MLAHLLICRTWNSQAGNLSALPLGTVPGSSFLLRYRVAPVALQAMIRPNLPYGKNKEGEARRKHTITGTRRKLHSPGSRGLVQGYRTLDFRPRTTGSDLTYLKNPDAEAVTDSP